MRHFILFCCVLFFALPLRAEPQSYIGDVKTYTAKHEDTLVKIARGNNLGYNEMRAANPFVDPWLPGEGTKITLPTRHLIPDADHKGIIINLPEMRIYLFDDAGKPILSHPIGVGRDGLSTPQGTTTVTRKKIGPTWRPTQRMRDENPDLPDAIKPGSQNPLGTHALYLGWPAYAIHGTNRPFGIGRRVSSGCIRLYPENILTFYDQVPVGTQVRVVNQPTKLAWIGDDLYLEAGPTLDQAMVVEENGAIQDYSITEDELKLITSKAGPDTHLDWTIIREVIRNRSGIPIKIGHKDDQPAAESL